MPERTKDVIPAVFSRHAGAYHERVATAMDRGEARARTRVVELLAPRAGERVLDQGCGPGILTLPLAEAVGASGLVLGVDLAAGMLDLLRAAAPPHAGVARMDMEALGVGGAAFDAVAAGNSLQFCPDLGRALAEVRRALRPGGRFAASLPRAGAPSPAMEILSGVFDRHLAPTPQPPDGLATREIVGDDDRLTAALRAAGFVDVEVERVEEVTSHAGPAELVSRTLSWWSCAARLDAVPEQVREAVRAETLRALRERLGDGPLTTSAVSAAVSARVPPGPHRPAP
jgi:SAM-dependent methyltransferase